MPVSVATSTINKICCWEIIEAKLYCEWSLMSQSTRTDVEGGCVLKPSPHERYCFCVPFSHLYPAAKKLTWRCGVFVSYLKVHIRSFLCCYREILQGCIVSFPNYHVCLIIFPFKILAFLLQSLICDTSGS